MNITLDYLAAIQNSTGLDDMQDVRLREAKRNLERELETSLYFKRDAMRNNEQQRLIVVPMKGSDVYRVIAFPDEPLNAGDYVRCDGVTWLITAVNAVDVLQLTGEAMVCNFKLRFQNDSPDIIERDAVLDSGVYSTTIAGEKPIFYPNDQFKVWLPLDDDTAKLHIDKRFATDIVFDQHGREILATYKFTKRDAITKSSRSTDHLLIMNVKADEYDSQRDSIEHMVCNYISPKRIIDVGEGWY